MKDWMWLAPQNFRCFVGLICCGSAFLRGLSTCPPVWSRPNSQSSHNPMFQGNPRSLPCAHSDWYPQATQVILICWPYDARIPRWYWSTHHANRTWIVQRCNTYLGFLWAVLDVVISFSFQLSQSSESFPASILYYSHLTALIPTFSEHSESFSAANLYYSHLTATSK
jgi:hypothetical protein